MVHRSTIIRNASNPRRNSGGTFKTWTAESGLPVENSDANFGFCFLIFEVSLRKTLLTSLDDFLAVVREFLNPNASRSGLDRCLRRHGVGNLRALKAKEAEPKHSAFKAYEPASTAGLSRHVYGPFGRQW